MISRAKEGTTVCECVYTRREEKDEKRAGFALFKRVPHRKVNLALRPSFAIIVTGSRGVFFYDDWWTKFQ